MREDLTKKRIFLLCGHAQSGKTSICETILFKCAATTRLGKVDEGTTISDYEEDEKARKSSINMSVLYTETKGNFLQFIDVPGYLDFIGELISASRAVDFGVIVIDATGGVEVGTEKAWDILRKENLPCLFIINKLDKENTDFERTLEDIQDSLTKKAIPFATFDKGKINSVLKDKNNPYYANIVETIAESDDALLNKYLEKGSLEEKEAAIALKKAIINSQIFPVIPMAATSEIGTDILLEILLEVMPSVAESKARLAKSTKSGENVNVEPKVNAPLAAQVFKTVIDPFVGQLNIFRVFAGKVSSNSEVYNSKKGEKEKISHVYLAQGKQQVSQDAVCAGEIGALAKLRNTSTQDTFCDISNPLEFPSLEFPTPSFAASVKPKTRQDEDKISAALSRLTSEDPTFRVSRDALTKELIISGMGELHLNVIIERMRRRYQANVELGTPKVAYKETITKSIKVQGKHKKQSGGRGQYGDVWIEVEPLERGKDFEFVDKIFGGAIPRNFIPSVEKGIRKALDEGILAGYPVSDIRVILCDGSYHPVDSSDIAFQIAGSMAFKKALEQAGSVLLEPIMTVEIMVPEEFMGQITGDINARRGRVLGMDTKGKSQVVKAQIPLSEMFKYASDLRSVTGGRGSYSMSFSHYEIVPARLAQNVIEEAKRGTEKVAKEA
ncbi:MAG: elongation factor G [Candidatus Omnitrophota bacterium]|nr:elongation factor G [Candidatus Omnitrophota bacterium]